MTRLELNDNLMSMAMKMSDGNPGALTVVMSIYKHVEHIDPMGAMGGFGPILSLDTLGIYGPDIWMLYKDVCKENLPRTIGVLRAWQLGFVEAKTLKHAIQNYGDGIKVGVLCDQVVERLDGKFNLEYSPDGSHDS